MAFFSASSDPRLFSCGCGKACDAPPPHPDLVARLELLRYRVGRPIRVTSGPRCPDWNRRQGGTETSDHLTGAGADLAVATSGERWELLDACLRGPAPLFTRLGIGRTFLHVGLAGPNPGHQIWTYYPRRS